MDHSAAVTGVFTFRTIARAAAAASTVGTALARFVVICSIAVGRRTLVLGVIRGVVVILIR
jgi:hypothetical protein